MTAAANYLSAADVFAGWRDEVLTGEPPTLYPVGTGELARIEIGPGLVTLIGGGPGAGKTALTMQLLTDALRLTPKLRALVCNVEMAPGALLNRQLSRLSGVNLTAIRYRKLGGKHADRLDQALNTLEPLAERFCFLRPPFGLGNVAAAADDFRADVLLLDYIQRIRPPGDHGDKRGSVDAAMDYLRQFADAGVAVVVVSAVGRSKDNRGRNTYAGDHLNLASFRESSELEFGADDAFIVAPDADSERVLLRHLKSRHGATQDLPLLFDRAHQSFKVETSTASHTKPDARKLRLAVASLWDRTAPAADDAGGDE